jgi:hypothetical protein
MALGLSEGIHWHINPDVQIEYVSKRDQRKVVPWVKYTNLATGEVILYEDEENSLKENKMAVAEVRTMDCMDCHNRPSHNYYTPQEFIDHALISGEIPKDLPFIKKVAMDLFIDPYDNKDTALLTINNYTHDFYAENYPEIFANRKADIDKAIEGIIHEFSQNIFPAMGASWDEYESHIGHKTYNGCFRCHDDNHKSTDGQIIRKDCNICHTLVLQGKPGSAEFTSIQNSLEFIHPVDLDEGWEKDLCTECHRYLY